jgi:hypothetical protein
MRDVRWEGFSHDEIYARVQQGPGRAASTDAEAAWSTVESTIRAVDEQLTRAIREIGVSWEGAAAERVHGGMTVMSTWALDAAGDALLTKNGIAAQAEQAAFVRTHMPPPRTAEWNQTMGQVLASEGFVPAIADLGALEDRMANDHARAVELMDQYSIRSVDNQKLMNYWTQPPTVVVETVAPSSPSAQAFSGTVGGQSATSLGPAPAAPDGTTSAAGAVVAPPVVGGTAPGQAGRPGRAGPGPAVRPSPPAPSPGGGGATTRRPPASAVPPGTSAGTGPVGGVRPVVPGPPGRTVPPVPADLLPGSSPRATGVVPVPGRGPVADPLPGGLARPAGEGAPARGVAAAEPGPHAPAGRGTTATGSGFLPLAGAVRPADHEHRRPDYLLDDSDAFADDRWFPPPVISGDDP